MALRKHFYFTPLAIFFSLTFAAQAQSGKQSMADDIKAVDKFFQKGNFKEAASSIDRMMSSDTTLSLSTETQYHYARIYAEAGESAKATKLLRTAVDKGFWSINRIKEDASFKKGLTAQDFESVLSHIRKLTMPYTQGKVILSKGEKKSVIELAKTGLKRWYFDAAKADEMSKEISKMFDEGFFDGKDTLSVFTNELVQYFRKKTNDKHFYIGVDRGQLTERIPNLSVTTPQERNFGFREVSVRNGNIGYIRWDECIAGPEAYETAQSALKLMRNTRAIVIDISGNGGGNGEISTFLYHYLFKPTDKRFESLLIKKCKGEADWHRSEPPVAPIAGGPDLGDKPIYVVTSGNTFSAAEYFAFMMKELKRATIIGKNTGGGGNPINTIGDGRFIMYVPTCQITTQEGKSLEGKGVAPDIELQNANWSREQLMEAIHADLKQKGN